MTFLNNVANSPVPQSSADPDADVASYDRAPGDQDVPCPLCDYNLRGATKSRCPECGYRFEWRDLLDPERRRHPYVFEHHPRHNTWSFMRTFRGALRPRTFWRTLRPGQPSNVRRLVLYWFIVNLFALALPLAMLGVDMARHAANNQQNRAFQARAPANRVAVSQAWLDAVYPLPPAFEFFRQYFSFTWRWRGFAAPLLIAAIYSAWPWLTFLALNVFQISMLRARVNASHVLRCVMYTFDALSLLCWALLLAACAVIVATILIAGREYWAGMATAAVICALAALVLFIYRLTIAYRLYLQFHQPFLTVLASQIIVALAAFTAALWFAMWNKRW